MTTSRGRNGRDREADDQGDAELGAAPDPLDTHREFVLIRFVGSFVAIPVVRVNYWGIE